MRVGLRLEGGAGRGGAGRVWGGVQHTMVLLLVKKECHRLDGCVCSLVMQLTHPLV